MTAEVKKAHRFTSSVRHLASRFTSVNIGQGQKVGYTEDHSEARLQPIAAHEGVKLYLNLDGSHEAIDESKAGDTLG